MQIDPETTSQSNITHGLLAGLCDLVVIQISIENTDVSPLLAPCYM